MQFQEKLIQTQKNDKKLHFGTDLVTWVKIRVTSYFSFQKYGFVIR